MFLVFGMLLGDTIILDNLDAANHYRREVCTFFFFQVTLFKELGNKKKTSHSYISMAT